MRKHTILFLAANPGATDHLALDREAREIQVELERSRLRDRFELVTRWATEPLDLLRELRRLAPTVVQFSGHGGDLRMDAAHERAWSARDVIATGGRADAAPCPGLYFQGSDGQPRVVSAGALREVFDAVGSSVRLVTLNACYSEAAAEALLAHVDCVVGIAGSISDAAARSFSIGFYGALAERASIDAAYRQACAAIPLEGYPDGNRPRLKVRPGVDADKLVLAALPPAELDWDPAQSSRAAGATPGAPMSADGRPRKVFATALSEPPTFVAHPPSAPAVRENRRRAAWLALAAGLGAVAVMLVLLGFRLVAPAAVVDASRGSISHVASVRRIPRDHMIATASSVFKDWKHYTFSPGNLIDDSLWTSWQPQRKPTGGVGEWFKITLNVPHTITGLELSNGFQRVDELGDLYYMNSRIENATVTFSDGSMLPVHLPDAAAPTVITLPAPKRCEWVMVTVESVYLGSKWSDVAVSEVHLLGMDR